MHFHFGKNGTKNSLQNGNTFMFCENTQRKYVSTRDIFAKKITEIERRQPQKESVNNKTLQAN